VRRWRSSRCASGLSAPAIYNSRGAPTGSADRPRIRTRPTLPRRPLRLWRGRRSRGRPRPCPRLRRVSPSPCGAGCLASSLGPGRPDPRRARCRSSARGDRRAPRASGSARQHACRGRSAGAPSPMMVKALRAASGNPRASHYQSLPPTSCARVTSRPAFTGLTYSLSLYPSKGCISGDRSVGRSSGGPLELLTVVVIPQPRFESADRPGNAERTLVFPRHLSLHGSDCS
jgi:hypothetical protein